MHLILYKQKSPQKVFALLLMAGFLYLLVSFLGSGMTYAQTNQPIDNNAPTPNSGTTGPTGPNPGANFTPITGVGYGAFNGQVTWYKIYIKNGQATNININQQCTGNNVPLVTYYLQSMSDQETFSGKFGPNPVPRQSKTNAITVGGKTTYSCSSTISFPSGVKGIGALRGISSTVEGHGGYRVFAFWAQVTVAPSPSDAEQYFSVTSTNGNNQNSYIGMSVPLVKNNIFKRTTIYKASGTWSASVMFAPRCDDSVKSTADIQVFDADNGGPNPPNTTGYQFSPYMYATLDRSDGRPLNWNVGPNWPKTFDDSVLQGGVKKWGQSNTTGTLTFQPNHGYLYRLNFIGSSYPNTIQITLPYDQFDASPIVRNSCAEFSCTATPINANTVRVVVTNDGQYKEGNGYEVVEKYSPVGNQVFHQVGTHKYKQDWTIPRDINKGSSLTSTNYHPTVDSNGHGPADTQVYFYRPAGQPVEFLLFDDSGLPDGQINWDNNGGNCGVTGGIISINCGSGTSPTGAPGTRFDSTYSFTTTNSTSAAGVGYHIVATPAPGLSNYPGSSNDISISVPIGAPPGSSVPQSVTFSFAATYQGTYTVNFMLNGSVLSPPSPCPPITITPQVSPYFQVWQNDAAAGGGFSTPSISCPGSAAYISPTTTGNQYSGGIIANSASGSPYQSKSDFGAVALGLIPGPANSGGFYASVGTTGPSLRTWFANPNGSNLPAGDLSSTSSNHCVKDFYTNTKINPTPHNIGSLAAAVDPNNCLADAAGMHRCQFTWNGGTDLTGINFPSHYQITIYVPSGSDITIDSNIFYNSFDPRDPADVPYFALITEGGNIYLKNNVTLLEGLYVAEPTLSGATVNGGIFATCNPSSQCNNQLVVNGAVIAQHVEPLRAHGASEGGVPNIISNTPAEIFNFAPSMVLGAPAFAPTCQIGCSQGTYKIAPVF